VQQTMNQCGFLVAILLDKENAEETKNAVNLEQTLAEKLQEFWVINKEDWKELNVAKELQLSTKQLFEQPDEAENRLNYVVSNNHLLEGPTYTHAGIHLGASSAERNKIGPIVKLLISTSIFVFGTQLYVD